MTKSLSEPVYIPRWALLAKYAFFVVLAGATALRGSTTLDLTTPQGYSIIWASAVALGALVAVVTLLVPRLAAGEKWAAIWIASWLGFVAFQAALAVPGSGWLYIAFVALLPAGRGIGLFTKRHA